jgi:flavodoxin
MAKGKTLIAYYSRNGHTKKVATDIAKTLGADIDEIIDLKDRSGIKGWLVAGKDAFTRKPTIIRFKKPLEKYDCLIIGTPVWAGRPTPAVRKYLENKMPRKVAFFCTYGGSPNITFSEMETITKIKPRATLAIRDRKVADSAEEIKEFCKKI